MRMKNLLGVALVAALLAGSALTIGLGSVSAQDQQSFPVQIRFLNAMTAQKSIDVYVNGSDKDERVVEGLEYGTISDTFEGTAPATGIVIKQNVNLGFDQWLFNTVIPTEAGKTYLVVVSDFVIIPVQEDATKATDDGAVVQLIHAASQAPAIDVSVDGNVVASDLKYGRATSAGIMAGGTFDIELSAAGTDTSMLDFPGATIENGNAYTFVVIGEPGSDEEPLTVVADVVMGSGSASASPVVVEATPSS